MRIPQGCAVRVILVATALGFSANANAQLLSRLGGLAYYDTATNLTWLANANAAVRSAYDTYSPGSGLMTWTDANAWAAGLTVDGVSGWRLPTTDTSCGLPYNCTGSEMGNLFYNVLGGTAYYSITADHNANYNDFSNVQSDYYWSATEYAPASSSAWLFDMAGGNQDAYAQDSGAYAWAVHTGDVSAIPGPAAVWLFGSGLLGLMGMGLKGRR